jgi:hypothetical protein
MRGQEADKLMSEYKLGQYNAEASDIDKIRRDVTPFSDPHYVSQVSLYGPGLTGAVYRLYRLNVHRGPWVPSRGFRLRRSSLGFCACGNLRM